MKNLAKNNTIGDVEIFMQEAYNKPTSDKNQDPGFLYRYCHIYTEKESRTKDIFLKNQLYFPSPKQFNDPFDCAISPFISGSPEKVKKFYYGVLKRKSPYLGSAERKKMQRVILHLKKIIKIKLNCFRKNTIQ